MSENTYKPRNFRIVRHVTRNRILDIRDALEIDKLRIELVEFAEGAGATQSVEHFAEPDALALVCYDILQGRPWEKYVEYKGVVQGDSAISRVLVIERVEARNPVKITIMRGPGKVVGQGAIQPLGKPEVTLSVLLSEFDARRIALTLLRHLIAYEAANYHARVEAGTRKPQAGDDVIEAAAEAVAEPAESRRQPAAEPEWPASTSEPEPEAPAPAPRHRPHAAEASARAAVRRVSAPAVETYWMAAERLGLARPDAEALLRSVNGDWGRAWSALRQREREAMAG